MERVRTERRPSQRLRRAFTVGASAAVAILIGVSAPPAVAAAARHDAGASAASVAASKRVGTVPRPVTSHAVASRRRHDSDAVLALNLGLAVHRSAELDAVIRDASTPGSPTYGRYLTQAQYKARYAPTDDEVAGVRSWLTDNGLRVTGVSPDNLIVSAEAKTSVAERAFGVTINDYTGQRSFYANDAAPSVPAQSSVQWVTGLDDALVVKSFVEPAFRLGGYFPSDFRSAYNVGVLTTTESIGFTLWGAPLVQNDLDQFAMHTGSSLLTIGPGANGIDFIPCSTSAGDCGGGQSTDRAALVETALDVESAHGIAPGGHMKYWLARTDGAGHPLQTSLENALAAAANDPVNVVSNSWGINADVHIPNMDTSLQHAAAVGKTFFFSSDDTADISYPAISPYVVSVGGTSLNLNPSSNYVSESAWNGSGTGCSEVFGRPSWQIGVGSFATCDGRAEPDVAADADLGTGAYVYVDDGTPDGPVWQVGGTSLAAPLWAGMTAVWNQANIAAGKPPVGLVTPLLYSLGNNKTVYHDIFHDVTTGSAGGNPAGAGWDQVTGWGSPNLANLIAVSQHLAPTSTTLGVSKNPDTAGGTVVYSATVSPVPNGGTVTFRQDSNSISGCSARPLTAGGHATCSIKYSRAAAYRIQAGYSGNADFAGGPSNIIAEKVNAAPPGAGYWMAGRTGVVYGFGSAKARGNANTQNVSHFEPTPSRNGYWIVNRAGQVYAFGDAHSYGNAAGLGAGESVSSLSTTPSGHGYWLFTSKGRALTFGDAHFYGDLRSKVLNGPVIGSVATPTGHGYYMVATDGGIFSFGDAGFYGSTGRLRLNKPVNGLVPTPTNRGYWMVASDGGIFAFGDATFRGSMGRRHLNSPVVGMVRYGNGYLMVGSDGGIFDFSDKPFLGSLAGRALPAPIVSVAS